MSRSDDSLEQALRKFAAQEFAQFVTGHSRQMNVQQDKIRFKLGKGLDGRAAIRGLGTGKPIGFENLASNKPNGLLVVNDEDLCYRCGRRVGLGRSADSCSSLFVDGTGY